MGIELSVTDDTGRPIKNVQVTINGVESLHRTDEAGKFYQTVVPGVYQVEISAAGYEVIYKVSGCCTCMS